MHWVAAVPVHFRHSGSQGIHQELTTDKPSSTQGSHAPSSFYSKNSGLAWSNQSMCLRNSLHSDTLKNENRLIRAKKSMNKITLTGFSIFMRNIPCWAAVQTSLLNHVVTRIALKTCHLNWIYETS